MYIEPDSIHVLIIDFLDFQDWESFFPILSPEENEVVNKFLSLRAKKEYTISHGVLRTVLGEYLGIKPILIKYENNLFGKPFLSADLSRIYPLHFNLSHSGNFALIGISHQPIGIDIEQIKGDFFQQEALENIVFSETETEIIKKYSTSEKLKIAYRTWTRKESVIKGIGKGLSICLRSIETCAHSFSGNQRVELKEADERKPPYFWNVFDLDIDSSYAAAIATQLTACKIKQFKYLPLHSTL